MNKVLIRTGASICAGGLAVVLATTGLFLPGRAMAAGTWTPLAHQAPDNIDTMLILSDGTVMAASGEPQSGQIGNAWYRLTPDSHGSYANGTWSFRAPMHDTRLYYSSDVLQDGRVFVAGGEYGTGGATSEIYDPVTDTWTTQPDSGQVFVDSGSVILPNGSVHINPVFPSTRNGTIIFNPAFSSWSAGGQSLNPRYETSQVKLPDDSIISIDPLDGVSQGTNSERYIPSMNAWVADANVPVNVNENLLAGGIVGETGPALLLPNGKAIFLGGTGHTAIYTPSGTSSPGAWVAGPDYPNGQVAADASGAMMVNGKVLSAVSPPADLTNNNLFPSPTTFYEYDTVANAWTQTGNPSGGTENYPSFITRMLVLPDGTVLFANSSPQLYVYHPDATPLAAGKPTITSITQNANGSFHLTGTLLNGISQGANYGDDAQMDSNYPLIRLVDSQGNVFYLRSLNWSRTSVMTGNAQVSTDFTVPANVPPATYSLIVSANGNSSDPITFTPVAAPDLVLSSEVLSGGNGNGVVDFNECNTLDIALANIGSADATGVQATLSTHTPGVFIGQHTAAFPGIPVGAVATNLTSFTISTTPTFSCGTTIDLELVVKCDENTTILTFHLNTGVPGAPVRLDNEAQAFIPPASPLGGVSAINVSGVNSALFKAIVAVEITHPFDASLMLQLIGPDGTTVDLSDNNGSGPNFGQDCFVDADRTIFDDGASNSIVTGTPPFVGSFQPQQPLAAFIGKSGTNVNGTWLLRAVDSIGFSGSINCWSLTLIPSTCTDGGGQCPGADLAVGMSELPVSVTVGQNVTYTINATNLGPDTATGVALNQTLSPSVVFVSANPSQGNFSRSGNTLSFNLGTVPAGGTVSISVVVQTTAGGAISSTATVGSLQPDPDFSNNTTTLATVVNNPLADLSLSLVANPSPALLGGVLTYAMSVTNGGPAGATVVIVTNQLPGVVTYVSASSSQGNVNNNLGGNVVWNVGSLAKGASATATVTCRISSSSSALGLISDTAGVFAMQADPVPGNNIATVVTQVTPAADLLLTMTGSPNSAIIGNNIIYNLTVLNLGPSAATNVNLVDVLPAGTTYLNTTNGGNPSIGSVTVNSNILNWIVTPNTNLPIGASATLSVVLNTALLPGPLPVTLTNTASVSSSLADPVSANNTASVSTVVDVATNRIVAGGQILIGESIVPHDGAVDPGETVTNLLILENTGNIPANAHVLATLQASGGVVLTNGPQAADYGLMPPGARVTNQFVFAASGNYGGTVTATLQLSGGASNAVRFTFFMPALASFANANTITIPQFGPADPYGSPITVSGLTNVIGKVTVTVTNFSHTFSDDVSMLLVGPSSSGSQQVLLLSHVGGDSGVSGAALTFDSTSPNVLVQANAISSGTYSNSVYGTWPTNVPAGPYGASMAAFNGTSANGTWSLYVYDSSPGDAGSIIGGWSLGVYTVQPVNQIVDLGVSGAASPSPVVTGNTLTYTFNITNSGPNAASGVTFTNTIVSANFVSASSPQGLAGQDVNGNIYCVLTNNLPAGGVAPVTVVVTAAPAVGTITSQATVTANEQDLNTSNNSTTIVTTENSQFADLAVGLSVAPGPVLVGGNLGYLVTVTNNGPGTAFNVQVRDQLPPNVVFSPANSFCASGVVTANPAGFVTCNVGSLSNGAGVLVLVGAVPQAVGSLTDTASMHTDSLDTNSANDTASIVVNAVVAAPLIVPVTNGVVLLSESGVPANGAIDPGETVTVSLPLTNIGTATAANLVATLQPTGGVSTNTTGPQSQSYGTVPAGSGSTGTFRFTAAGVNGGTLTATLQLASGASNLGTAVFVFPLPATNRYANNSGITIFESGPASPYPSVINVSGLTGVVGKVTVTLTNLSHAFPDDVNALLVSPGGADVMLMSGTGGGYGITNVTLGFDDSAAGSLSASGPLVAGVFKPTNNHPSRNLPGPAPSAPYGGALSSLNGGAPNGNWQLYVFDSSAGDAGSIAGWSVQISTLNPLPSASVAAILTQAQTHASAFSMTVLGQSGQSYVIEASTNLSTGVGWVPVSTNTATATATPGVYGFLYSNTDVGTYPGRFYRARTVP